MNWNGCVTVLVLLGAGVAGCRGGLRQQQAAEREAPTAGTVTALGTETVVALDTATIGRIGLRVATLANATHPVETEAPAVVVADPGATTTVRAGTSGRLAAVADHRWPRVGDRLAAGAGIALVGDARPIPVPRGGTVTRLLAQPGEMVQAGQPLLELTDFSAPLVRVTWPAGTAEPPGSLPFRALGASRRFSGLLEGPAPEADPLTGGPAILYRLAGGGELLRPGAALVALVREPSSGAPAVEIPAGAVVQWEALAWAYVEREPGKFARVRVPTDRPVPGGWRVESGFAPGERVVVVGAGQLLSEEFRAKIVVGEEVGE
jgi:biotin carboxyl carrier protein